MGVRFGGGHTDPSDCDARPTHLIVKDNNTRDDHTESMYLLKSLGIFTVFEKDACGGFSSSGKHTHQGIPPRAPEGQEPDPGIFRISWPLYTREETGHGLCTQPVAAVPTRSKSNYHANAFDASHPRYDCPEPAAQSPCISVIYYRRDGSIDFPHSNASTWRGEEGTLLQDWDNIVNSSARNAVLFATWLRASFGERADDVRIDANAMCQAWQFRSDDGVCRKGRVWDLAPTGTLPAPAVERDTEGNVEMADGAAGTSLLDKHKGSLFDAVQVEGVSIIALVEEMRAILESEPMVKMIEDDGRYKNHVELAPGFEARETANIVLDTIKAHHRSFNAISQSAMIDGESPRRRPVQAPDSLWRQAARYMRVFSPEQIRRARRVRSTGFPDMKNTVAHLSLSAEEEEEEAEIEQGRRGREGQGQGERE